jgi:hypothetical protein
VGNTKSLKRARQSIRAFVERAVGHALSADDVCGLRTAHGCVAPQNIAQRQHGYFNSMRISR